MDAVRSAPADADFQPRRLTRADLPHETIALARALIGVTLVHDIPKGRLALRVVETEAYPVGDRAGHHFNGQTKRNTPLFRAFGCVYVYLGYGVSWLLNTSSEAEGVGAGVLFRAGEPITGVDEMIRRRGRGRLTDL